MPSINKLKQYQQLHSKKFRQKYGLFVVEGLKSVNEVAKSNWQVETILCTKAFAHKYSEQIDALYEVIDTEIFHNISTLKNPQEVLAIVPFQSPKVAASAWSIALDGINDPGNLGTIIRIADWYGISTIYCSKNSVDLYNAKVVQATMGSFLRVSVLEVDLNEILKNKNVYATVLNGKNIREIQPASSGVILVGNEANGISEAVLSEIKHIPVTIPKIGQAESLNAGIATAICCERLLPNP